ncbi:hypothetical protein GH714_030764 [Hevea brasiliensis]|uniref:Major facilitator superfamily (MFS) profile domain-containing protein n=1 Tax=Hevea brasiliensis TaxID=3981 RepID=A0A6A6LGJ2_HEVBR|nr:hypothetical protein GH714_030764 [Hevea brasiliensis]
MAENLDLMRKTPPGILLLRSIRGRGWSLNTYRYVILLITFIAYACYHASRKPSSIVKSVLDPEPNKSSGEYPWPIGNIFIKEEFLGVNKAGVEDKGWYPFNGPDGTSKLGEIDVAFLACYSLVAFSWGYLGWDTFGIHVFGFYLIMQMLAGLFQATGWPSVVAVIGASIVVGGILVFLFLAAYPEDVGFPCANCPREKVEAVSSDMEAQANKGKIGGEYVSVKSAGNLSTLFDVGGIVGGILAGYISDKLRARAITATSFYVCCNSFHFLYRAYVSADLGTHSSLRGDSRALATVTAIIDGTGSIGAALGPLFTGFLSTMGWDAVFDADGPISSSPIPATMPPKSTAIPPTSSATPPSSAVTTPPAATPISSPPTSSPPLTATPNASPPTISPTTSPSSSPPSPTAPQSSPPEVAAPPAPVDQHHLLPPGRQHLL